MNNAGDNILVILLGLAYFAWAMHVGNKVLTGIGWRNKNTKANKIGKFILAFFIGGTIAGLYTMWALIKWAAGDHR